MFRLPAGNLPDDRVCRVERVCYSSVLTGVCTVVKRVFRVIPSGLYMPGGGTGVLHALLISCYQAVNFNLKTVIWK